MKILSHLLFIITFLLFTVSASAAPEIDLTGIYQANNGSNNFLTINRNNEQYVLVNISKELGLLYKLGLITEQEFNQSLVNPPVEEFAFFFTINNSELLFPGEGIQLRKEFIPDIIIPFPDRSSSLTALPYPFVSIRTITVIGNGPDLEIVSTTRDVAPYCLISVDINTSSNQIIVGFERFTSPEFIGTDQAFIAIDQYYKKIF